VPVHGLAISPKRRGDEQRMWEILTKLVDEDPCLKVEHVASTNETVIYGLGELHLRILLERLRDTYKFEVATNGGQFQAVTKYTVGRITGMRYEQGNPILTIGDTINLPMSQLTQIRG
jgi:translation elongation factor EF-G